MATVLDFNDHNVTSTFNGATAAMIAHNNLFSRRRGVLELGENLLAVYDNNPVEKYPDLQDRLLTEAAGILIEKGSDILSAGSAGDDAQPGYTRALVIRSEMTIREVLDVVEAAFRKVAPADVEWRADW